MADAVGSIAAELDRAVQVIPELANPDPTTRLVGLAGTVSTLASVELGLEDYDRSRIHQAVLTRGGRRALVRRPRPRAVAERARRPALPEGRQDVIFGGALVLSEVMRRFGLPECLVSESDILDGLVMSILHRSGRRRPGNG